MTRRPVARRLARIVVMPALILLVAWALTSTARQRDARRLETLDRVVTGWCRTAERGEEPPMPVVSELPRDRVMEALQSACRTSAGPTNWSVAVAKGTGAAPSAGRATHHAVIRIDGVDDLGLLFGFSGRQPVVVGYWLVP